MLISNADFQQTLLQDPGPKPTKAARRGTKVSPTSVTNSEKVRTVSDSARHRHVYADKR